ncbi:MAG TPA: carboxymuconolactone decarboxylase family protein [Gemmatimonadaceae bacterium]|nr:carboxymuconolactone decarboxylase family protein [Gemmatimonadaceae bacterium]
MQARMKHPVLIVPAALQALLTLSATTQNLGLPAKTIYLIQLRASQINGCSYCVDMHARELREAGETDERLATVSVWRDATWFTDAERAALALTEAATRLSDRDDAVPDAVWEEARKHYDDNALSSVLLNIAIINLWNRLNVPTRQPVGGND